MKIITTIAFWLFMIVSTLNFAIASVNFYRGDDELGNRRIKLGYLQMILALAIYLVFLK